MEHLCRKFKGLYDNSSTWGKVFWMFISILLILLYIVVISPIILGLRMLLLSFAKGPERAMDELFVQQLLDPLNLFFLFFGD